MRAARAAIASLRAGWIWLVVGAVAGAFIPTNGLRGLLRDLPGLAARTSADRSDAAASESDHGDHEDVVLISELAGRNLRLRTGRVRVASFLQTIQIPGTVRERPALSDLTVSCRVEGVVTEVFALPGQAVRLGQPLFRIELTGENLAAAQSELLDAIQQVETTRKELERLGEAAKLGGVPAKRVKQLSYDLDRYELQRDNKQQELIIRGLTSAQVDSIAKDRKLLREVVVKMPEVLESVAPPMTGDDRKSFGDGLNFTIEDLHVHPGKAVKPTDKLCDVAYHTNLYFEGQAFEKDVETIRAITQDERRVSIEFGTGTETTKVVSLRILYIDNHVDPDTQTFRFYIPLPNEVLGDVKDGEAVFRSWRFKPGQRGHVLIPLEELTGSFPLPREAVSVDGPDAFVFRQLPDDHAHDHADEGTDHAHDHGKEYEAVPVHVVFQDDRTAVVAAGDKLQAGDRIAMNRAYELQLALKSGDGSAHGHDHPH